MHKIPCKRCGQDYLILAEIKPLAKRIVLCPECDAFWWPEEEFAQRNYKEFGSYLDGKGLEWNWNILDIIGAAEKQ